MANIDLGEGLMPMVLGFGDNRAESGQRNSEGLIHYQGELGDFWYDPMEFEIVNAVYGQYLHYVGFGKVVNLPEGCVYTRYMFYQCNLPFGFTLGEKFDTSNVTCMQGMFQSCELPAGFTLGEKFDTSNVTNMAEMFQHCKLPAGFTLGDKFSTSNVRNMSSMFAECKFPAGFTLGDKFDTSKVNDMSGMFYACRIAAGFSLGDKFDTSIVVYMQEMFSECILTGDSTFAQIEDTEAKIAYLREKRLNIVSNAQATASENKTLLNDFLKILGKKPDEYFWLQSNYEKLSKDQLLSIITSFMVVIEGNALEKLYDKVRDNYEGN